MTKEENISKLISKLRHKPNKTIIERLNEGSFPLASLPIFSNYNGYLAAKEFTRCHEMLKDKMPYEFSLSRKELSEKLESTFIGIHNMIVSKEKPHKEKLQQMAIDIVREIYNVPDQIDLSAFITDKFNMDLEPSEQDDLDEINLSPERMEYLKEEINKRKLLNAFTHGSSFHIWKSSHWIVKEKLDRLDKSLIDLYDIYTTVSGFQLWQVDIDMVMMMIEQGDECNGVINGYIKQGFNKVEFKEKNKVGIESHGVNFCTLMHELNKGVIDYLICHGIPKDLTEDELIYYYSQADKYQDEPWYYYLSPSIWSDLLEVINKDSQDIPKVIHKLSLLNYKVLYEILDCIINNPEQAKSKMKTWKLI